jgi:glycosyltransferase involved in cell wall biosynthesis
LSEITLNNEKAESILIRVVHIITSLQTGGAEMMLYKLLANLDREEFESSVICLSDEGPVGEQIQALGIPVRSLGMKPSLPDPLLFWRLVRWLRQAQPDVVQTWMYHADLLGSLAARLAGGLPVAWNVQSGGLNPASDKRRTIWIQKLLARFSRSLTGQIVFCSEASKTEHVKIGYSADHMPFIPNGTDIERFKPDSAIRQEVRAELGIAESDLLVGNVARFHPVKDHQNFIQAAGYIHHQMPDARFLLCGDGIDWENAELVGWVEQAGIREAVCLLGRRADVPRLVKAFDLFMLSSQSEGFPNVIGEAMASGVPCVVTDVGDAAIIVGNTGRVASAGDSAGLAQAALELLQMSPDEFEGLRQAARQRIVQEFSLAQSVAQYGTLYRAMTAQK